MNRLQKEIDSVIDSISECQRFLNRAKNHLVKLKDVKEYQYRMKSRSAIKRSALDLRCLLSELFN